MKLDQLSIKNFVGLRDVALDLHGAAVHLFVGPNGAGKTSLRDAVAWALTNRARGVEVKDAAVLGHAGGDPFVQILGRHGSTEVMVQRSAATGSAIGATANKLGFKTAQALAAALAGDRLLDCGLDERQANLFLACGVEFTDEMLRAAGVDDGEVVQCALHRSFASAARLASDRRREAGKVAEALASRLPEDGDLEWPLDGKPRRLSAVTKDEFEALKVGIKQLEGDHRAAASAENEALSKAREEVGRLNAEFQAAERALSGAKAGLGQVETLPANCGCTIKAGCAIHIDVPTRVTAARETLAAALKAFDVAGKALEGATTRAAALRSAEIGKKTDALVILSGEIERRKAALHRVAEYRKAVNALADVEKRHADQEALVERYGKMELALKPGGLVAKLVEEPARRFAVAANAVAGYWTPTTRFGEDLSFAYDGGRLPSASETWRARAAAAIGVAAASGLRFVMLDEASLLFGQPRGRLVQAALAAVNAGYVEQALIFASSHERPKPVQDALKGKMQVWWVDGGTVKPAGELAQATVG